MVARWARGGRSVAAMGWGIPFVRTGRLRDRSPLRPRAVHEHGMNAAARGLGHQEPDIRAGVAMVDVRTTMTRGRP
jgi:hypothetical protein